MTYKFEYTDETSRQSIIEANSDKVLKEDQIITDGNFLIFDDTKPIEQELSELNDNQLTIMSAIADLYTTITV